MTRPDERILYGSAGPDGRMPYWRMPTIWAAAEGKPQVMLEIEQLGILDEIVWFGGPKNVQPTVRKIAEHALDIMAVDLTCPIITTRAGEVLDGAHRIARAYLEGIGSIPAVVLDEWPPPDGLLKAPA
jgi:hypothetical protein